MKLTEFALDQSQTTFQNTHVVYCGIQPVHIAMMLAMMKKMDSLMIQKNERLIQLFVYCPWIMRLQSRSREGWYKVVKLGVKILYKRILKRTNRKRKNLKDSIAEDERKIRLRLLLMMKKQALKYFNSKKMQEVSIQAFQYKEIRKQN